VSIRRLSFEDRLHPLLGLYMRSPQWIKASIGRAYGALPARLKYGPSYARFRDEAARCYDSEGVAALVDAKLASTLRHALEHVPAYAAYRSLLREVDQPRDLLRKLPITSKLDLRRDLEAYASMAHSVGRRLEMFTGGSTANPMRFFFHRGVTRPKENAYFDDLNRRAGLQPDSVILNLRGRTVPGAGMPGRRLWMYEPIKRHLILSSDHLEARFMPQYAQAIREWKPTFIAAYSSALYPLAKWLQQHGDPALVRSVRGVLLTSENVYRYQLDLYRSVFGCPVLRGYGHTERAVLGASMPDDDRYFFWPLYGYLELIDVDGQPIEEPGRVGELVATGFDNEVMPFVRYRTGDFGSWGAEPHPQLPGWKSVEQIDGRLQEFLVCRDRRLVTPNSLSAAHYAELSVAEWIQYEQSEPGRVLLRVVAQRELMPSESESIARALHRKSQGGIDFEVRQVAEIARTGNGKQRMVIQHLDVSDYLGAASVQPSERSKLPGHDWIDASA
jgi:phenylacetate-CoA ligase